MGGLHGLKLAHEVNVVKLERCEHDLPASRTGGPQYSPFANCLITTPILDVACVDGGGD